MSNNMALLGTVLFSTNNFQIMFLLLLFRITNTFSEGKKFHITMKPSSRMSEKKKWNPDCSKYVSNGISLWSRNIHRSKIFAKFFLDILVSFVYNKGNYWGSDSDFAITWRLEYEMDNDTVPVSFPVISVT